MATTIQSSFDLFKSNIEITDLQASTVSSRQQAVREAIQKHEKVIDSFLTGSYSRSTLIAPLNEADIDIFVILDPEYFEQSGQAKLLDRMRTTLIKTYPLTPKISRNGQAVTISFSDFTVDVVPSFYREGGGYLIPDTINQMWISTDPKKHVEYMSEQNAVHNGSLVPLIKMIKTWNKNTGSFLSSFYLELLVAKILTNVTISDFPSGARYFFANGIEQVKFKVRDPSMIGSDVSGLNGHSVEDAITKFKTAYECARRAEQLNQDGKVPEAVDEWRKIFGDRFPAYG